MVLRIGVLGGTFDPVHLGHLIIAEEARVQLNLEEVIFIPAGEPRLRTAPLATAQQRLDMVRLAVAGNRFFRAGSNEMSHSGPTYTVDTLQELLQELKPGTLLYFILGPDALAQFQQWKSPDKVLELCDIVAVSRPEVPNVGLVHLKARYPEASDKVLLLHVPAIGVSSTEIRRRVASGISIKYQVPEAVERYIMENRLYQLLA